MKPRSPDARSAEERSREESLEQANCLPTKQVALQQHGVTLVCGHVPAQRQRSGQRVVQVKHCVEDLCRRAHGRQQRIVDSQSDGAGFAVTQAVGSGQACHSDRCPEPGSGPVPMKQPCWHGVTVQRHGSTADVRVVRFGRYAVSIQATEDVHPASVHALSANQALCPSYRFSAGRPRCRGARSVLLGRAPAAPGGRTAAWWAARAP